MNRVCGNCDNVIVNQAAKYCGKCGTKLRTLAALIGRIEKRKENNRKLYEKVIEENRGNKVEKIFTDELFRRLMEEISKKFQTHTVQQLALLLLGYMSYLSRFLDNQNDMSKLNTFRCENFIALFQDHLDLDVGPDDALQMMITNDTPDEMLHYLLDCPLCLCKKSRNKVINLNCECNVCHDCFCQGYKVAIDSPESKISLNAFSCLYCKKPEYKPNDNKNKEEWDEHFGILNRFVNVLLEQDYREKFDKIITEATLEMSKNFVWCGHCKNGAYVNPDYYTQTLKVQCSSCKKHTCFKCKTKWEPDHEGKTCTQKELNIQTIDCPKCNFMYQLDVGGCLHYTCTRCRHEFCGSCREQMTRERPLPECTDKCRALGLHAHHPYNCFFYIRDVHPESLDNFLKKHSLNVAVNIQNIQKCPINEKDEQGQVKTCNEDVYSFRGNLCGLCKKHLNINFYYPIADKKLDPLEVYDSNELNAIIQRSNKSHQAPVIATQIESEICGSYITFIRNTLKIKMKDLSGNRF